MPEELPSFQGWTVDARLREFRKADPDAGMQRVPFDSPRGQDLLDAFCDSGDPAFGLIDASETAHFAPETEAERRRVLTLISKAPFAAQEISQRLRIPVAIVEIRLRELEQRGQIAHR